jgi:hypothetical protein
MTAMVAEVVAAIEAHRFAYVDEDELQQGLAEVLAPFGVRREVRLNARCRIDLLAGRVGIELKIGGSAAALLRQVERYAELPELDALVVVTSRVRHLQPVDEANGKPVRWITVGAL